MSGDGRSRKQGRECGAGVVVVGEVGQRDGWCRCWSAWATRWLVPLVKWMHWDSEPTVGVGGVRGVAAGCDRSVSCRTRGGVCLT